MNEDYSQPFFVPHRMAKRLGWAHAGYLPPLEEERLPVESTCLPTQDYFLLGRMVYLEHQVDSLKKGYHTHKGQPESYTIK